eukprot:scaffold342_cov128-Amphora_coffeaeformis.AAC.3
MAATQRSRSNSPHTFVSRYNNQEMWNALGSGTATTDEDDDDEEEDDDPDAHVHHNSCDDSSHQDAVQHHVSHLARKHYARDMDECSSLSSNTRDNDLDLLLSSDDEEVVVTGADNPPKAPERTRTRDDPLQEQAKVKSRATVARKHPPLRGAPDSSATVSDKESDFFSRRKQRLMGRTSIQNNHQDEQAAVAVAESKATPFFATSSTSTAAVASTSTFASAASLSTASFASSAAAASTSTDGKQRAGTSMAELEDDLKKQAARPAAGMIMERRAPTAARLNSEESYRTVNSSASSSMQARWAARQNNNMAPSYAPAPVDRAARKVASSLDEEGPSFGAAQVSPPAVPLAVSRADDRAAAKAATANQDTCKGQDPELASKKAPPSTPSDLHTAMQARVASNDYETAVPLAANRADDRAAAKVAGNNSETLKNPPRKASVSSSLETAMQARSASRAFPGAAPLAVSRADDRAAAKVATMNDEGPQLIGVGKKSPPWTNSVSSDLQAAMQARSASRASTVPIPLAVSRTDDKVAAKAAGKTNEDPKLTDKKSHPDTTVPSSDLEVAMQARNASRSTAVPVPLAVSRADDRAATKRAGNNPEGFKVASKKSTVEASHPHPDLRESMQARNASRESLVPVPVADGRAYDRAAGKASGEGKGPQLASPSTPSLQAALQARRVSGASSAPAPLAVSRADDRAAAKVAVMDDFSDDEQGPKLAIASTHKNPLSNKSLLDSDYPEPTQRSSSRRSLASIAKPTSKNATYSSSENEGCLVPTIDKKVSTSDLQAAMQSRTSAVSGPTTVNWMLDRAAAKLARDEKSFEEDQGPKLEVGPKRSPPSDLKAAMQARTSSRTSAVPMPTTVSRMLDRAAAKMGDNDESSDEEQGPKLAPDQRKPPSSNLEAAMQARSVSRASTVPMPTSVSRLLDVAAAKMADDDESSDEGPSLAGAAQSRKPSKKSTTSSAGMAMRTRGSSGIELPQSVPRDMDRAAAKMVDDDDGDESSLEGPSLADATQNRKKSQKPAPSSAGMAMRTRVSSGVEMPRSVSRDMDRVAAKMANGDESSDEEEGPRLAQRAEPSGGPAYASSRSRSSGQSSPFRSSRRPSAITESEEEDLHLAGPKKAPGAIASSEDLALQKKVREFADDEEQDEGPTLATTGNLKDDLDYDFDHDGIEPVREDEFLVVSGVDDTTYDVEAQEEDIVEAQTGLVVSKGAYAVRGIDAPPGEDDLFRESIDPTNTAAIEEELESVRQESIPGVTVAATVVPPGGALEAELYEEAHVEADLYEEVDLENDPKYLRKLRLMQGIILCSSIAGLGFVIFSVILGFGSDSYEAPTMPEITGWRPVGDAIFGPEFEQAQALFGSAVSMTSSGKRIATIGPGVDNDNTANVGAVYIWEESVIEGWSEVDPTPVNKTWKLTKSIEGPGSSATASSSLAMTLDGGRIAVGYPFYEAGQVQIFDEANGWQQEFVITSEGNATGNENLFGYAVDLSQDGDFLAVGAPLDVLSGSVRVMERASDGSWQQIGEVIRGSQPGELFGWSISLVKAATLRVAIGSPSHDTDTGLLRVYDLRGSDWMQVGETLAGIDLLNRFGEACVLSSDGNVLAVGVRGSAFEPGAVHIYRDVSGQWEMDPQILRGSELGGAFGSALSMTPDGNTLAIGAPGNDEFGNDNGIIQVWSFDGAGWTQQGSNIGGSEETAYGSSVSISADGQRVVGGAPQADYDGSVAETGQFRVYDRD